MGHYFLDTSTTVCPGSSDPFYIASLLYKWVTTSWIYCIIRHIFHITDHGQAGLTVYSYKQFVHVYHLSMFSVCLCQWIVHDVKLLSMWRVFLWAEFVFVYYLCTSNIRSCLRVCPFWFFFSCEQFVMSIIYPFWYFFMWTVCLCLLFIHV